MPSDTHSLEESLKSYLIDEQSDKYNSRNMNLYKYNNLRILMEPRQNEKPHIIIRIGISESMYSLETRERLSGGLGSDEKIIRKWIEKSYIRIDLMRLWEAAIKIKPVIMKEDLDDEFEP